MDVTKIVQPGIEVFGILIMEPVTTITNLLIASACLYGYNYLRVQNQTHKYVKYYFLSMGISTLWGGIIGHAFLYLVDERLKLVGWALSMISVALIERSAISHVAKMVSKKVANFFLVLNIVELVILVFLVFSTMHFKFVEWHSAYGFLVVVTSFHLYAYRKTKDQGSLWMLRNTVLLLVAVFVFNYPVIIDTYFNHRDFAHVLMIIASFLILIGTRKLETYPEK